MKIANRFTAAIIAAAVTTVVGATSAHAAVLASDNFNSYTAGGTYPVGALNGQGTVVAGAGWSTAYQVDGGAGSATHYQVLNATPLAGGSGNYVYSPGGYQHADRVLDIKPVTGVFAAYISDTNASHPSARIDQGVLWASVLVRDTSTTKDSHDSFGFDDNVNANGAGTNSAIYVGQFNTNGIWSVGGLGTTTVDTTVHVVAGQTELVVFKLDMNSDTASIYFNPTSASATPAAVVSYTGAKGLGIEDFRLYGKAPNLDNLLIGQNLGDVAAIPEPASLTLLGMGGLTLLSRRRKNTRV